MLIWSSLDLRPDDPIHMLWRYANGAFPCFVSDDVHGPVGWIKCSHRGVIWLGKLHIGDKQRRQIMDKRFEFRCDAAFEEVVRFCADPGRDGFTWLTENLICGFVRLHRIGFAHSFEAWEAGQLVGGAFGVQLGAVMMIQSIFHRADNAGKAAFVRGMLHLCDRGFELIDLNLLPDHAVRWGAHWVPQHEYERALKRLIGRMVSVDGGRPAARLPWQIRSALPIARLAHSTLRRFSRAGRRILAAAGT